MEESYHRMREKFEKAAHHRDLLLSVIEIKETSIPVTPNPNAPTTRSWMKRPNLMKSSRNCMPLGEAKCSKRSPRISIR